MKLNFIMSYFLFIYSDITKVRLSNTADQTTYTIPEAGTLNAMTVYSGNVLQLLGIYILSDFATFLK